MSILTPILFCLLCLSVSSFLAPDFKGKVVLVTGGSEGIGHATSLLLARRGANVVFCARDLHPTWFNGSATEKSINSDGLVKLAGGSAKFFRADIRNITQVRDFINYAHALYGRIDHAVNNAGIGGWAGNIQDIPDEVFLGPHDPILNNLYGAINCIREEAKYWYKYGNPNETYSIVTISSQNGVQSCPGCSMYAASKYGIIGVVKSAALEFINVKPKIRINAICPGLVDTSLTRNQVKMDFGQQDWEGEYISRENPLWPPFEEKWRAQLPGKRLAKPEELARAIISVLDNENSFMNGAVISVDDGGTDQ